VGLSVLISLFVINPKRIIVADSSAEKRNLALSLGVQLVFDSTSEDFIDKIMNLSNGGVDVAYDCAGSTESIETAFKCIKAPGGQLIFASHPNSGEKIKLDPFDLIRGKTIRGSWGGNSLPDRDIPKFTKLLGRQLSNLNNLLGKRYCLDDINLALDSLDDGEIFRPIIDMKI
jgi:S-(hydroxymethyl)glutathione dehydrogenase/alcohol dehydrogenase